MPFKKSQGTYINEVEVELFENFRLTLYNTFLSNVLLFLITEKFNHAVNRRGHRLFHLGSDDS